MPHPSDFDAHLRDIAELLTRERANDAARVLPPTKPGDVAAQFERTAPDDPRPWSETLDQIETRILPHITRWFHPGFMGYFPASTSEPAMLGELLSAGLGQQGMLWQTSPACTELETRVMDWLARALGLPERFCAEPIDHDGSPVGGGVIQGTASEAVLCVIAAARDRALARLPEGERWPVRCAVYTSEQAHSSVEKACRVLGPQTVARAVPTDARLRMDPSALSSMIEEDARTPGVVPCCVVATLGTTSTCAVDPIDAIGRLAESHGLWAHVDAAYMGAQLILPDQRHHIAGVERFDSFTMNPHKWLLVNFDCSALWLSPGARRDLIGTMSITPEYLRTSASESGAVIDYRDWHVPLGRRFRALKLWMVLRHYGLSGLRAYIRKHLEWARAFASWVEHDARYELAFPVESGLICLSHVGGDEVTQCVLERVNATGRFFLTHCRAPAGRSDTNRYLIRVALANERTTKGHTEDLWRTLQSLADA
ncbi:MAG: aspartate aminotransferase family protein [Phycisphaerales bacterium]